VNPKAGVLLCVLVLAMGGLQADVTLETRDLRVEIGSDAVCRSIVAKKTGKEYCWTKRPGAAFWVTLGRKSYPATAARLKGDILTVEFAAVKIALGMKVTRTDEYVALELASVEGDRPDIVNMLDLRVKPLPYLGPWIDVAYDDEFGICLCAGNVKTNAMMCPPGKDRGYVGMAARAYRDVQLEGATAVLFGCENPRENFLDRMTRIERAFDMPRGAEHRRSPVQKYSYLWVAPTPDDIHEYIRWAKRGGFRMILFSYGAFTKGAGHFIWNDKYPNGMADLKKVTKAIRDAGLALGLHIHYNKAHKTDPYVTPVPDDRLHKERRFTLASAVDEKADVIAVKENPKGCTLDRGRRILKVGKELISYTEYTVEPPYRFTGCRRGALKTTCSAHAAGEEVALLDVDTWPIFIRFDQDTDIQDEAARRIADIYEETGPYDMVYFDGAEDVHDPFWYHCANAQLRVFKLLKPAPSVCEAAANRHFSWHMMTRSNAYDSVAPPEMKEFCRKYPCRTAPRRAMDFSRINFGWLHGFSRSGQSYITPDTLEYVLSRGAAWDCPFSMSLKLEQLENNPRTESCFDVIKIWEDARIEGKLTDAQREQLKNLDQEHHLFINEKGGYELVPIEDVGPVAGSKWVRAYTFQREDGKDTYVLMWAAADDVDIVLAVSPGRVEAMRPFGRKVALQSEGGKVKVAVGERMYLAFKGMGVAEVRGLLENAKCLGCVPVMIYRQAEKFDKSAGRIGLASASGTKDAEAMGDCVVPTGPGSEEVQQTSFVEYRFDIPYKGRWYLWGRMKYRGTGSNSFFAQIADRPETRQRFGNSYVWGKWLWDSQVMFKLEKGPVAVRVYVRESALKVSPLLDVICLTNDGAYTPSDEDAAKRLAR